MTDVASATLSYISYKCDNPVFSGGVLIDCGVGSDTAETVKQIMAHNAKLAEINK